MDRQTVGRLDGPEDMTKLTDVFRDLYIYLKDQNLCMKRSTKLRVKFLQSWSECEVEYSLLHFPVNDILAVNVG
jgi:hypothetical protein